jgi:AcrR family transcriptional regulator
MQDETEPDCEMSKSGPARVSPGRPTREQARQRQVHLLEVALNSFLEDGLEAATMERIAVAAGMSKRTVYAYYGDKEALFRAAVERAIERYTVPRTTIDALFADMPGADIEQTLRAVARLRVTNVSDPASIKLQRVLTAQAHRFPDLFDAAFAHGVGPTIAFLCDLFAAAEVRGELSVYEPERAASAFLSLVVGGVARIIVAGSPISEAEVEARIDYGLRLFLDGVRRR